jgi:hypothetical protein
MKKVLSITIITLIIFILSMQSGCRKDMQLPDASCDTVHTFKDAVMPILTTNCRLSGCHIGSNPPNGVSFNTYAEVKSQLALFNGIPKLLGVIRHDNGFDPMPKDSPKLDTCSIYKIRRWIEDGAQNN